jgi:hypothetical protein
MQRLIVAILVAVTLAIIPCSADKGKPGKGKAKGEGKSHATRTTGFQVSVGIFSTHERDLIRGYYAQPKHKHKHKHKHKQKLPPGLEKQLRRNGHLPPGLEKEIHPMPYELEHRLPRLGAGHQRGFIDGKVIIYNQKTRAIIDIFAVL